MQSLQLGIPIIILEGSDMAKEVFQITEGGKGQPTGTQQRRDVITKLAKAPYVRCKESSEDLASIVHLMLSITLF